MITSKEYLAKASKLLDVELLEAAHLQQVAKWCLQHWKKYHDAPGSTIESKYEAWSEHNDNKELVKAVYDFLDGLSREYEKAKDTNIPCLLDELREVMKSRKIKKLMDDLEYAKSRGEMDTAAQAIADFRLLEEEELQETRPQRGKGWEDVFADPMEPVIQFEGDAGRFFNCILTRDALVAIQAPEKTGKTWWLIEMAFRALRQRKKVAFFEVGDLSRKQLWMRLGVRWASLPMWEAQLKGVRVPQEIVFSDPEEDGEEVDKKRKKKPRAGYSIRVLRTKHDSIITERHVRVGIRKFQRSCGHGKGVDYLRTSVHATATLNVSGIEAILDQWKDEDDFIPDVIVIDYADILAPEESKRRHEHDRNVTNDTWKAMRRMSQKRHALVLTATQANAKAYTQSLQSMGSFSEDKRKYSHVTAMFGLNQTPEEKDMQGMRLNQIVVRESPYSITRPLYVGTCYALGRALCVAKFESRKK
jgi:hypothetical protein